jgi:hypothetical protein
MSLRNCGGFPREWFVDDLSIELNCGICLEITNDPQQCKNGHLFCTNCFLNSIKYVKKCPVCSTSVEPNYLCKNRFANNMIRTSLVRCPCRSEPLSMDLVGCAWTGTLDAREVRDCPFLYTRCTNADCGELKIKRTDLEAHLNTKCVKRMKRCKHCNVFHQFDALNFHQKECELRPILCDCGLKVSFQGFGLHRANICGAVQVSCPVYTKYGVCVETCLGEVARRDVESHLGDSSKLIMFMLLNNK